MRSLLLTGPAASLLFRSETVIVSLDKVLSPTLFTSCLSTAGLGSFGSAVAFLQRKQKTRFFFLIALIFSKQKSSFACGSQKFEHLRMALLYLLFKAHYKDPSDDNIVLSKITNISCTYTTALNQHLINVKNMSVCSNNENTVLKRTTGTPL